MILVLTFLFGAMCGALVLAMTLILVSGTSEKSTIKMDPQVLTNYEE